MEKPKAMPFQVALSEEQINTLLRKAAGVVQSGVTIVDMSQPEQPIIYVNAGFEVLTGYTAAEVLGRNCRFLQGDERDQEAIPVMRKAIAAGKASRVILRNYRKDGSSFWNELLLYPLYNENGVLTHFLGTQYDINDIVERSKQLIGAERQAAQEAAQHAYSLTRLNEMSRQLNLAVCEKDVYAIAARYTPQIIKADRIHVALITADKSHLDVIGLTGQAGSALEGQRIPLVGNDIEEAILGSDLFVQHDQTTEMVGDALTRLSAPLVTGGLIIGMLQVTARQPHLFTQREEHLLLQIASLLASNIQSRRLFAQMQAALDENTRLYTAAREHNVALQSALEQLHSTQTQLIAAEKMASLGRLVAGLAHEINTPIGIAVTAASVWEDRTTELVQLYHSGQIQRSDLEEYIQTILESGRLISNNLNRAAELIQSFKQVAVDQSSESARTINLKSYIDEVVLSLQPELKRTYLTTTVGGDEDLVLQSYPGALYQILTNLIFNSVIHAYEPDASGQLTITISRQNDKAYLVYSDDGKGIPSEDQGKIFEPFFTTRRGQGGSGLGLHIVYNLVTQRLGGTIRMQSRTGVGTTFTICLPLVLPNAPPDISSLNTHPSVRATAK